MTLDWMAVDCINRPAYEPEKEDERRTLEMEMHRKINSLAEILGKLEGLQGGGGSGFILEKAEISNGKIAVFAYNQRAGILPRNV